MIKAKIILWILVAVLTAHNIAAEETDREIPDYRSMMFINSLVPGFAQLQMDKRTEGIIYLTSVPLTLAGEGILLFTVLRNLGGISLWVSKDTENTYLTSFGKDRVETSDYVLLFTGLTLTLYGTLLSAHSQYDAHRTYMDRYSGQLGYDPLRFGSDRLTDLMAAPWIPRNVFDPMVMPVLVLTSAAGIAQGGLRSMAGFFSRDSVDFWGARVSPWAGLSLMFGTSVLFVWANATWEEIAFRGLSLETMGRGYSSVSFGLAHLPNMLVPGVGVEDTVLQSIAATAFGFYAAEVTKRSGYSLEKAVALHFWNNILALMLGYLSDPEETYGFYIHYTLTY